MKKRIENNITMFKTVMSYCSLNTALISPIPGLNNLFMQYVTKVNEVLAIAQTQIYNRKGITLNKKAAKETLALAIEEAAGIIMSHFDSINDHSVYEMMNISLSKLKGMRDMKLITHAELVKGVLTDEQPALAPFNVDAAYITSFGAKLTAFTDIVSAPTISSNERKAATAELDSRIKTITYFLTHELDKAMLVLKASQPNFYSRYVYARSIINNGIRHIKLATGILKGVVKDETTDLVIANAIIEIINTPTLVLSDEFGVFTIVNIPPDTYDIKVSVGDYENKTVENIAININETTNVEIKLTPLSE